MKKFLKIGVICFAFALSFIGVSYSVQTKKIAGVTANVSLLSLGTQAQAYCIAEGGTHNTKNGGCTGSFDDPTTRCMSLLNPWDNDCYHSN